MRTVSRHSGIEVLGVAECKRRLAQDVVGRIAVVIGATPLIYPVNYTLDGDAIVMRTMPGSKLDVGQGLAAFEVDRLDRDRLSGWTVLVTGILEEVGRDHAEELAALGAAPVVWPAGERGLWLRLRPSFISGHIVRPSSVA